MLRLLRRPKSRSIPHSLFRTQLRLERLEGRELPSVAPVLSGALSGAKMSSPSDVAPGIISFTCTQVGANTYVFSGVVTSPDLSSTTVHLGGLPSLSGVTCGVGADGSFSVTVSLQSGEQGMASAQATDSMTGLASAVAYCPVYGGGSGHVPGGGNYGN